MNINKPQKYLLYFSSVIIFLMVLYPPVKIEHYIGLEIFQEAHAGYKFINTLSTEVESVIDRKKYPVSIYKIDNERYFIQFTGALFITLMLFFGFSSYENRKGIKETPSLGEKVGDGTLNETTTLSKPTISFRDSKISFNTFEKVGLTLLVFGLLIFLLLLKDVDGEFATANISFLLGYFIFPVIFFVVGIALLLIKKKESPIET